MTRPDLFLASLWAMITGRLRREVPDRGDVPGWVLVTIMTAAIVVVLIPFVGPVIAHAFEHAVNSVSNTNSSTH